MKKLLLSLSAVVLGFSAYAGQVTFNFQNETYGLERMSGSTQEGYITPGTQVTTGDVVITLNGMADKNNWRLWTDGLRAYSSGEPSFTVTTSTGEKVNFVTWKLKNSNIAICLQGSTSPITEWEGPAESVTFDAVNSNGNNAIVSITVTYGDTVYEPEPEPEVEEFTVAEALAYIAAGNSGTAIVSGYITEVASFNSNYGSITYYIGDTVDATEVLQIYGGLGLNGEKFNSKMDLVVGAQVQVKGTLKLYTNNNTGVSTPEMDMNNVLLSYNAEGLDAPEVPSAPEGVLSVSEAINDYINKGYSGEALVKGKIVNLVEFIESYGEINYYIQDIETEDQLYIYNGFNQGGAEFTSIDELEVGAVVTISGTLTEYNGEPEMARGNYIVEYVSPAGVEGIAADNAPAVYYNLQGVRVNNPEQGGIYIIRQGSKTRKAIIR